ARAKIDVGADDAVKAEADVAVVILEGPLREGAIEEGRPDPTPPGDRHPAGRRHAECRHGAPRCRAARRLAERRRLDTRRQLSDTELEAEIAGRADSRRRLPDHAAR